MGGRAVKQAEPVAEGVAHAVRLLPVLTSRRHIDLQRVCSSMA
ncbi:putative leader peptide [Kitasatospora sp. NPDC058965]